MRPSLTRRLGLSAAIACSLAPFLAVGAEPALQTQFYSGKVVPLAGLLEKFGARLDPDAVPTWLALVTAEGKVYPLIKGEGSRMFYQEPSLQNRPMRLTGRLYADTHLLQVINVHSFIKGELHDVYYWCDICVIKRFEKRDCECCGAPMELRETPVKK